MNLEDNNWISIMFKDLKIGDLIKIEFYPYSQIDLPVKYGKIVTITNEIADKTIYNDELTIENLYLENEFNKNFCAAHDWISYYGNSRGYDYEIFKYINN